ncbi:MAG: CHAT domain-containing protein [Synechococcales bacterium]|nr:CHAT domain-containing protein [Synechococcales bacterium]
MPCRALHHFQYPQRRTHKRRYQTPHQSQRPGPRHLRLPRWTRRPPQRPRRTQDYHPLHRESPTGLYPGSLNLNQASTFSRFKQELADRPYNIVHIATHGTFNPTQPNDSFLLFSSGKPGIGDRFTFNRIEQQDDLRKVHLVVLSACQTASGQSSTSGIEIQGLSAAFVRDRAKSVIASLWNVNDASTALLMQQFYKNLAKGMTKAEALRQVQRQFIKGELTPKDADRLRSDIDVQVIDSTREARPPNFIHPYYWAPFILIGNSL